MTDKETADHYKVDELATIMRVTPSTVRRYVDTGQLAAYRLDDGQIRITPDAFRTFQRDRVVLDKHGNDFTGQQAKHQGRASMITIHKRIFDAQGRQATMCPGTGGKMTAYRWHDVNCKRCLEYHALDLSSRQIREIARMRTEKQDKRRHDA